RTGADQPRRSFRRSRSVVSLRPRSCHIGVEPGIFASVRKSDAWRIGQFVNLDPHNALKRSRSMRRPAGPFNVKVSGHSMKTSRRTFLTGAATLAAGAYSGSAFGQSVIDEILASTKRGNWNDQFDAR